MKLRPALDTVGAVVAAGLFVAAPARPSWIQHLDLWLTTCLDGTRVDLELYLDGLERCPGPWWLSGTMYVLAAQALADVVLALAVVAGLVPRARAWARLLGAGAAATLLDGDKLIWFGYRSPTACDALRFAPLLVALGAAALLLDRARRERHGTVIARSLACVALLFVVTPSCSDAWSAYVPWGAKALTISLALPLLMTGWPERVEAPAGPDPT